MKRYAMLVAALVASFLMSGLPVLSADYSLGKFDKLPRKDECLLFAKNCQDNLYVTQQRVNRLQEEISRGTDVYSHEELNILKQKLDNARKALEFLMTEGA